MSGERLATDIIFKACSFFVGVAAVLVFSFFMSAADMAGSRMGVFPIPPTVAAPVLLAPFVILLLLRELLARRPAASVFALFKSNKAVILSFLGVVAMSLLCSSQSTAYWQENGKWIYIVSYGFTIFLFTALAVLLDSVAFAFRPAAFTAILLLVGSLLWDITYPGTFSTSSGRPAGFAGNANVGALILNMLCATVLSYDLKRTAFRDFLILSIVGLGVFITQSRSGLLCFTLLFLYYAIGGLSQGKLEAQRVLMFLLGPTIVGGLLFLMASYFVQTSDMWSSRQLRFSRFLAEGSMEDDSSDARLSAVRNCLRLIEKSPIIGYGTGYSRRLPVLPHNIYLQQWVNNGILGLAGYLAILGTSFLLFKIRRSRQGQAFIMVVFVGGFFSHNMLDHRAFLMLLGGLLSMTAMKSLRRARSERREIEEREIQPFTARLPAGYELDHSWP